MPAPKKGEKKHEYIERCMKVVIKEAEDKGKDMKPNQAYAICNSYWEKDKKK